MPFSTLGLTPNLLRALSELDHAMPTVVQSEVIPSAIAGRDIWAQAPTGSGKTAAFVLPILQRLHLSARKLTAPSSALILVPTRELAMQVGEAFRNLGRYLPEHARIVTAFGGVSINPQLITLSKGADIVVATPGRLLDLLEHNALSISNLSTLVLDEADRLWDMGFANELGRIIRLLPKTRQTMLFSATFPPEVKQMGDELLRDPLRVEITTVTTTIPEIVERAIEVDAPQRTQLLRHLIQTNKWTQVLVFVATKYATEHVADKLCRARIKAGALNGELSQGARTQAPQDFKAGKLQVLVATDLAARGIDIVQLPVVVNYDLPRSVVDYTHRIGRTGRAGQCGAAFSFISAETHAHFSLIEKRRKHIILREQVAGFEPQQISTDTPVPTGGIKGKRKSKKDKLREGSTGLSIPLTPACSAKTNSYRWHRSPSDRLSH